MTAVIKECVYRVSVRGSHGLGSHRVKCHFHNYAFTPVNARNARSKTWSVFTQAANSIARICHAKNAGNISEFDELLIDTIQLENFPVYISANSKHSSENRINRNAWRNWPKM